MTFMTAGSGDESDKQFRDEDARDHQRNRGKKVTPMEEIQNRINMDKMTLRLRTRQAKCSRGVL